MGELLFKHRVHYPLQDVDEPNLIREQFPYTEIPRMLFDEDAVPVNPADDIWITDTTFRDGQQARPPYKAEQIVDLYKLMSKLGGPNGIIRASEFFLYSKKDKEAVNRCLELGCQFPEVTGWIRANRDDLKIVKEMGLKETGVLTSASDYHIFQKLKKSRRQCMDDYLAIVKEAVSLGLRLRCHFEDVTRADIYGFCVPFASELMKIMHDSGISIKIRLCDTMGFGLPYANAVLPRSVPKLIRAMTDDAGVPSSQLEWHGHNDFHKVHVNGITAWLYGCSSLNASLLGIGERTGNPPLEAAVIEYVSMKGNTEDADLTAISEIADYFRDVLNFPIPNMYPFVGSEFNTTSAGIHVDGLQKDEEIYNIFDTGGILNRPPRIQITDKSGAAGIAHWFNTTLELEPRARIDKRNPGVVSINEWVMEQYTEGRTTSISHDEMLAQAVRFFPDYFDIDVEVIHEAVRRIGEELLTRTAKEDDMVGMDSAKQDAMLEKIMAENPFLQLSMVVDKNGRKNTNIFVPSGKISSEMEAVLDKDYLQKAWFQIPYENGHVHITGLFVSRVTGLLGVTMAAPIHKGDEIVGVLRLDCNFEHLFRSSREAFIAEVKRKG